MSKKKLLGSLAKEVATEESVIKKKSTTSKRSPTQSRKKSVLETPEDNSELPVKSDFTELEVNTPSASSEYSKKTPRRTRKKGKFFHFIC